MAAEAGADAGVDKETMFTLIKKGGPVMIPLGIASVLALAIALERLISLRREKILPAGFLQGLGESWDSDPSGVSAETFCNESPGAAGHVFKAGIQWRDAGYQAVGKALEQRDAAKLDLRQLKKEQRRSDMGQPEDKPGRQAQAIRRRRLAKGKADGKQRACGNQVAGPRVSGIDVRYKAIERRRV
jgi:hypothetical protein